MQSATTVRLFPSDLASFEDSILHHVLNGILPPTGPLSQNSIASLSVDIMDGETDDVDPRPPMLIPGFVGFVNELFAKFPDFVYVADIDHDFYRHALIAASCDVTAIRAGNQGTVYVDAAAYIERAQAEIARYERVSEARCDYDDAVWGTHGPDLFEYLFQS